MNVVVSRELKDYMAKKGYTCIELGLAEASTCCSGMAEVYTGFLTDKGAARVKDTVRRRLPSDAGDILVTARGLEFDDEVRLGLRTFLGLKDITVQGVRAFSL